MFVSSAGFCVENENDDDDDDRADATAGAAVAADADDCDARICCVTTAILFANDDVDVDDVVELDDDVVDDNAVGEVSLAPCEENEEKMRKKNMIERARVHGRTS